MTTNSSQGNRPLKEEEHNVPKDQPYGLIPQGQAKSLAHTSTITATLLCCLVLFTLQPSAG